MEKKYSDIKLYAKLGFLIFADGYTAQIGGMKPAKDNQNKDVWEFLLAPSEELIKRYKLEANEKGEMVYVKQLPYDLIIQLNADPSWTRYFYLGNWEGEDSPSVQFLKGTKQQKIIMDLKAEIEILKMKLEVTKEKKDLVEKNLPEYLKRNFTPILDQMTPLMEKLMKEGRKE